MRLAVIVTAAALAAVAPAARAQTTQAAPASTVVTFRNELPSSYRLTRVRLVVDGAIRHDGRNLDTAILPPGGHVVEVIADYRMHNSVFSYMDRYGIEVRSAHVVRPGRHATRLDARAIPHGGATTPIERSAVIAWAER